MQLEGNYCELLPRLESLLELSVIKKKPVFVEVIVMHSSSSCKFQRYCYVQYEGMFNTIEQVVFIEQNQCHQTKKIKYFRAISLKKIEL